MTARAVPPTTRPCLCPIARHRHGQLGAYMRDGCRCDPCRLANSRQCKKIRNRKLLRINPWAPSCGTRRRLQALVAIGWDGQSLADRLDCTPQAVAWLRTWDGQLLKVTAAKVSALYDELWDQPRTGTFKASYARTIAAKNGWVPPMAWDDDEIDNPTARPRSSRYVDRDEYSVPDEVVVQRLMAGADIPRTKREQKEAIARLIAQGQSTAVIAELVGVNFDAARRTRNRITAAERQTA